MEPSPRESTPSGSKRVMEELVRCRGYAMKLEDIFATLGNNPDWEGELTRYLVEKVLSSIDNSLSLFNHYEPNASEDSEGSVRTYLPTPRERRGCFKRRNNGEIWTKLTPSMSRRPSTAKIRAKTNPRF